MSDPLARVNLWILGSNFGGRHLTEREPQWRLPQHRLDPVSEGQAETTESKQANGRQTALQRVADPRDALLTDRNVTDDR